MTDRHKKLLKIVTDNKCIEVSRLSELLNVSQVTIRKDLSILEEKGLLHRKHGYAVINSSDDINSRLAVNYDTKKKIAELASELVSDGETVMIESGSCCALLAEELAYNKKDITIITNSVFIASHVREAPLARIILLGGEYQMESQVLVGPLAREGVKNFFVDKLFVGTDGYNPKVGFTGKDLMRTETVKTMAQNVDKVVVLTESSKFFQQGVVVQFDTAEVDCVITDNKIPQHILELLKEYKIDVLRAIL
ncbi:MAG: DeoR/GlpR family DNA-binding transcription regulator [Clostridium sp.]|jgi:DeoR/GlpR family transcriptional regulator of sugar metabolism|uniref:DeoR/GlpR family DNA-binding transcription regulator n=1 Tax=Clostridium sp. TaxID=1506 RepID=UPI0025C3AC8D|nr:DeoR/GlpR family DNA-binding transcription regulator [Clostridium sp.]MCH3964939.1 DeoR/GlpR family DNA-binding transcription regulator [Clostridium sp.]MCI1716567.1 DeoR/GlpR family DNA-binding transcription regulator [Clostridium sp.]MCI1800951.1 DeoR/GlpR family DNA-binding transcription regulator [Clostridium sp.]MCI1814744.1 DeoR/GlpR family DNA-binding transcription regulator [Clostridium sp.]MCI1871698.1 DeoR/GlpR family DNA-binding transcription regulator [Clostridium sp.]